VRPSGVRTLVGILADLLVVVAIVLTARVLVEFFGQLAAKPWGHAVIALTNPIVLPLGVTAPKTPYGGTFDVNACLTVIVLVALDWVLSSIKDRY
jgi:hypothetical protein